jgi:hypothetical protein
MSSHPIPCHVLSSHISSHPMSCHHNSSHPVMSSSSHPIPCHVISSNPTHLISSHLISQEGTRFSKLCYYTTVGYSVALLSEWRYGTMKGWLDI